MTEPLPPIRLILDTTALLAYTAGSMDVAETLNQVMENGCHFAVPAVVAAEALAHLDDPHDRATLHRLFGSDPCELLDTNADAWHELAHWRAATGGLDRAAAVLAALDHGAWVLTAQPKPYGEDLPIIDIPEG